MTVMVLDGLSSKHRELRDEALHVVRVLELHGRGSLPRDLRRAFVNRDRARMADLIDDELLDAVAVAGRPDEAPDRLRAWEGVAERVVLGVPWYGLDQDRQRDAIEAALEFGAGVVAGR